MNYRFGTGFDVHAFTFGSSITLLGIQIAHTHKLLGHSDADVAMHALTDAILGAIAEGDIGHHIPPSDTRWKDVDSEVFLLKAVKMMKEKKFTIANLDITIICEYPKIRNHANSMRENVARICSISMSQVNVKATTTEKLGFTGRNEGIASMASALLSKQNE